MRLTGSVGKNGKNWASDVLVIQGLLNDRLQGTAPALNADGKCGPKTIAAIEVFQKQVMKMANPDDVVDPNGPTIRALSPMPHKVAPPIPIKTGKKPVTISKKIPDDVIKAAQNSQKTWKVPASISLAQWIIESGYGAHMPAGSNNPFGMKAKAGQPFVVARTREEIDGKSVYIDAKFRAFASIDEAFNEHGRLLATFKPYQPAMAYANDPDAFADKLTHVYATDSQYGAKLKDVMKRANLYQYNNLKP
jgi:hypothetical protein